MGFDEIYDYQQKIIVLMGASLDSVEVEIKNIKTSMEKISSSWGSQAGDRNVLLNRLGNVRKELGKNVAKLRGFCGSAVYYLSQMKKFDRYDGQTFLGSCKVSDVTYNKKKSTTIKCKPKDLQGYVAGINKSATALSISASDLKTLVNAVDSNIAYAVGLGKSKLNMHRKNISYQVDILRSVATDLGQMATNYINAEAKIEKVIADLKAGAISTSQLAQMVNEQVKQGISDVDIYAPDTTIIGNISSNSETADDIWSWIKDIHETYVNDVSLGNAGDKIGTISTVAGYLEHYETIKNDLKDGYQAEDSNNLIDLFADVLGDLADKSPDNNILVELALSYGANSLKNVNSGIENKLPVEDIVFQAGGVGLLEAFDDVVLKDSNLTIAYLPAKGISKIFGFDLEQEAIRATGYDNAFKAVTSAPKKLVEEVKKNATWDNWKSGMKIWGDKIKKRFGFG